MPYRCPAPQTRLSVTISSPFITQHREFNIVPNGAVGSTAWAESAGPMRALGAESRLEHQLGGGEEASGWPKRLLARWLRRHRHGAFWVEMHLTVEMKPPLDTYAQVTNLTPLLLHAWSYSRRLLISRECPTAADSARELSTFALSDLYCGYLGAPGPHISSRVCRRGTLL